MNRVPILTIGLPAYNAAATIGPSIESLLAQTFGEFELLVSDNASTDGTREVVEAYVRADPRVRYLRQSENIGANGNYSHLVRVARGEFFKWAASSDLCAPTFVEKCVTALATRPDAVLAVPRTCTFVGDPSTAKRYDHDIEIIDATPSARLRALNSSLRLNNVLNGVVRLDALRRTRLIEPYYGADIVLVGHLALLGKILLVDEPLFFRRMEVSAATALQDPVACRRHHYPRLSARVLFQDWKRQYGWLRAGAATPMSFAEKMRVLSYLTQMCVWERRKLWDNVQQAFDYLFRGKRTL